MEEGAPIRVFLADDHEVVRQGLRVLLKGEPEIEVVGEASSGEEALKIIEELQPDVILMDIRMQGMGGFKATREVRKMYPKTSVILLTGYDSELYAAEALRAGAVGFITKDCPRKLLSNAIRVVAHGGTVWQNEPLYQSLLIQLPMSKTEDRYGDTRASLDEQLTARELEVLTLLAKGYANKQISATLDLADITIKKYVRSIMVKLGVSNRTQAALLASRLGLV